MDEQERERSADFFRAINRRIDILAQEVGHIDQQMGAAVTVAADVLELSRAVERDRATLTDTRTALKLALDRLDALERGRSQCECTVSRRIEELTCRVDALDVEAFRVSMPPDVPDLELALRRIAHGEGGAEDAETVAGFAVRLESRIAQLETHARVDKELNAAACGAMVGPFDATTRGPCRLVERHAGPHRGQRAR